MKKFLLQMTLLGCVLAGAVNAAAVRALPGLSNVVISANDDGSSGPANIGFTLNYFGNTWDQLYVNNNGNLTFGAGMSTFTPFAINDNTQAIIAPFFADVDTRGDGSGLVTYGTDTLDGRGVFGVNYVDVGYYSGQTDKLNSFQVLLIDRADTGAGNFDIEFNYDRILWETGSASDGIDGFGGSSARAGYSSGPVPAGATANSFEIAGAGINGALLDGGPNSLTAGSFNSGVAGRYLFAVRNGDVAVPGATQDNPVQPSIIVPGAGPNQPPVFQFNNARSGDWFDPPSVYGFEFEMLSGGVFFSDILNFPLGPAFTNLTVNVGGSSYSGFNFGDSFAFAPGTTNFSITGISPLLDPDDPNFPNAFPIQLGFSSSTGVSFTMTPLAEPVPEPTTWLLVGAGSAGLMLFRRRRAQ